MIFFSQFARSLTLMNIRVIFFCYCTESDPNINYESYKWKQEISEELCAMGEIDVWEVS